MQYFWGEFCDIISFLSYTSRTHQNAKIWSVAGEGQRHSTIVTTWLPRAESKCYSHQNLHSSENHSAHGILKTVSRTIRSNFMKVSMFSICPTLTGFSCSALLGVLVCKEILDRIPCPAWQSVFLDCLKRIPVGVWKTSGPAQRYGDGWSRVEQVSSYLHTALARIERLPASCWKRSVGYNLHIDY